MEKKRSIRGMAKGYLVSNQYRMAMEKVYKGLQYQYRDRKVNKRKFRIAKIRVINSQLRFIHTKNKYSLFLHAMKINGINLNRHSLYELALLEPKSFKSLYYALLSQ